MAVAQKTSIWGRGIDTLRDTTGKIKRAGSGIINQIKPFGSGKKPKIGPTGGGYQPRGQFGGGVSRGPTWGEQIEAGNRRAQQIWGQKYRDRQNRWMEEYADTIRRNQWEQRRLNDMTWQPWKDPRRPLSGGMGPKSPTLTPLGAGNQAAKEGARKVGQKVIAGGAAKGLGLGLKAIPILGEGIIVAQSGFELGKGIAEALNEAERKIWEIAGYVPPLGENGTIPGSTDEFPEEPPPPPPPEPLPVPVPYPESFEEIPEITVNASGDGWYKIRVESFFSYSEQLYNLNVPSRTREVFNTSMPKQTSHAWVRGPRQKFVNRYKSFSITFNPMSWHLQDIPYIAGTGYRLINPARPDDPPIFYDANPRYRPQLLGSEPQIIHLSSLHGTNTGNYNFDEYYFGDRRWGKSTIFVGTKWLNEDGSPEGGGEAPAPFPNRPRRREDEEMADCPNIKPLLIQQNAIIEAKLNQQITEVNEIVAGMQLEMNAGNQNIINAVNQADANIAADFTEVKNRLGPQIPDGISTKVSNHYDEFKNFLGEGWNTAKGTFNDLMDKFNEYLETFKKFLKWMQIDRVLNILTFIATVHNAYMLSANLGQTLISALNTIFTVVGNSLGLRDVEDAPIDVGEAIGDTFENLAKTILGAENLENMRAEWKKYSRIYQAASHLLWAIQSINQSIIGALEIVGSNVAKIGNAIKKWGEVAENAYAWMNPTPYFQNKFFTTLESLEDAGGTIEIVALETLSAQEEISQFQQVKEEFDKAMSQANDGKQSAGSPEAQQVKAAEDAAKTGSASNI